MPDCKVVVFIPTDNISSTIGWGAVFVHVDIYRRVRATLGEQTSIVVLHPRDISEQSLRTKLDQLASILDLAPITQMLAVDWSNPNSWPKGDYLLYPELHPHYSPYYWDKLRSSLLGDGTGEVWSHEILYSVRQDQSLTSLQQAGWSVGEVLLYLGLCPITRSGDWNSSVTISEGAREKTRTFLQQTRVSRFIENGDERQTRSDIAVFHRDLESFVCAMGALETIDNGLRVALSLFDFVENASSFLVQGREAYPPLEVLRHFILYIVEDHSVEGVPEWPRPDQRLMGDELLDIGVQVDGKIRARLKVTRNEFESEQYLISLALEQPRVQAMMKGRAPKQVRLVPYKLISVETGS